MNLRNVAIIAHVDHGKTTLVDQLLAQSGVFRANEATTERAMDSNDQEKERGITILAKCTSVLWNGKAGETRINIIDTPGHADFGGEVERILGMVDGCVILVDAEEGVMPQTKFVLTKALKMGLRPILCINKVDRAHADPDRVHNETFDLFAAIGATDEQLDFPHIYASGRNGWATLDLNQPNDNLAPLFDLIVDHVPPPAVQANKDKPFRMLDVLIESDPFLGRLLTGRIESGKAVPGMAIHALDREGKEIERGRITKVLAFRGLKRQALDEGSEAGDIVAIAGMSKATVADTLCAMEVTEPLDAQPIDPPTISMTVSVNDSPLAGREGDKVQSRVIRDRLLKEAEANVAIRVTTTEGGDAYEVAGRGELQLGVLIENMRREGFEVSISRPRVVFQTGENGEKLEPIEDVMIDVDDEFSGIVIEKLSARKAEMTDMGPSGAGKTRISLKAPSRSGVLNRVFSHYEPHKGAIAGRLKGVLISNSDGDTAAFALWNLEDRGVMFVGAGEKTYQGMIIGENARWDDLDVNPIKGKQLTNVRAAGKDEAVRLTPPRQMSLEQAIAYIDDDELVEVTPKSIRLRKQVLNPSFRKKRVRPE
jgi:GTP-binding protein